MTPDGNRRRLAFQIYTGVAGALILTGVVFGVAFHLIESQRYATLVETVALAVDSIVKQHETAVANELFVHHREALGLIALEMRETREVIGVTIHGQDGRVLVESVEPDLADLRSRIDPPAAGAPYQVEPGHFLDRPLLVYTRPIMIIGEPMGFVRVFYTLEAIRNKARRAAFLFLTLFLALLLALFFIIRHLLDRRVIRPVDALRQGMEAVREGGMGKQIEGIAENEIGDLARAFNEMSGTNARMYRELRELNVSLERKVAERTAQVEKANQAKSQFLANMSHEIRTPMNAVLGFAEILLSRSRDPEHRNYLETILSSGKSLLTLINDILDLSKIEAGRLELSREPVNLEGLTAEVLRMFRLKAKEKSIALDAEISPELPEWVVGDEVRLRQVLINLVGNAVKFTDQGRVRLTVRGATPEEARTPASVDRTAVVFEVADTGIGISVDQQERIFDAFERQKDAGRESEGTGLGLAISGKLVEMMNGVISVESGPGRGSLFRVILREMAVAGRSSGPSRRGSAESGTPVGEVLFEPATVLVTDDVRTNRELVRAYLRGTGLTVAEAEDGEKVLALFSSGGPPPDLILMDLRLPGLDGYQLTEILKSREPSRRVPVIAFTAQAMTSDREKIATLFDGSLYKPLGREALVAELKRFLPVRGGTGETAPGAHRGVAAPGESGPPAPELRAALEDEMLPAWEEIEDVCYLDGVVRFAERLGALADAHGSASLSAYAEELSRCAHNVQVDGMERLMGAFPDLVASFRTAASNGGRPLIPPPTDNLRELRRLATLGLMGRVEAHATRLAEADGRYLPFAGRLRALARDFEDSRLIAFIDGFLDEGAAL